jgi:predicted secreted protein
MALQHAIILAAAVIAAPPSGSATPPAASDGAVIAGKAGLVIGAASVCQSINHDRLRTAAARIRALVERITTSKAELAAARERFNDGLERGGRSGTSCENAALALTELEKIFTPVRR